MDAPSLERLTTAIPESPDNAVIGTLSCLMERAIQHYGIAPDFQMVSNHPFQAPLKQWRA